MNIASQDGDGHTLTLDQMYKYKRQNPSTHPLLADPLMGPSGCTAPACGSPELSQGESREKGGECQQDDAAQGCCSLRDWNDVPSRSCIVDTGLARTKAISGDNNDFISYKFPPLPLIYAIPVELPAVRGWCKHW